MFQIAYQYLPLLTYQNIITVFNEEVFNTGEIQKKTLHCDIFFKFVNFMLFNSCFITWMELNLNIKADLSMKN